MPPLRWPELDLPVGRGLAAAPAGVDVAVVDSGHDGRHDERHEDRDEDGRQEAYAERSPGLAPGLDVVRVVLLLVQGRCSLGAVRRRLPGAGGYALRQRRVVGCPERGAVVVVVCAAHASACARRWVPYRRAVDVHRGLGGFDILTISATLKQ